MAIWIYGKLSREVGFPSTCIAVALYFFKIIFPIRIPVQSINLSSLDLYKIDHFRAHFTLSYHLCIKVDRFNWGIMWKIMHKGVWLWLWLKVKTIKFFAHVMKLISMWGWETIYHEKWKNWILLYVGHIHFSTLPCFIHLRPLRFHMWMIWKSQMPP